MKTSRKVAHICSYYCTNMRNEVSIVELVAVVRNSINTEYIVRDRSNQLHLVKSEQLISRA